MSVDMIGTPIGALHVAPATIDQAPAVRALRNDLARWMLHRGIRQWNPGEMPLEWIETCISWGAVHVVTHGGRIIASVTVVWADPFVWGERADPAGYVHMLMVDREWAGHGIGDSVLAWAEAMIRSTGRRYARLDCAQGNHPLRAYYEHAGYGLVGYKAFPGVEGGQDTALYEKELTRAL